MAHLGDAVVFSQTRLPSRQSGVVAGISSPTAMDPPLKRARTEPHSKRLLVKALKRGDRLGFGVRHDHLKQLKVTTLQGSVSELRVGDTLLAVDGVDLTNMDFLTVIGHLKDTKPGELEFLVERSSQEGVRAVDNGVSAPTTVSTALSQPVAMGMPPSPVVWNQNGVHEKPKVLDRGSTGLGPAALQGVIPGPVTSNGTAVNGAQPQPQKKPRRPAQRAVTMLDTNGQPVNVTALIAELAKEKAEKAALEEKNAALRKRLQRVLIENDEVRVRASNDVAAAQEKAKREVSEAQKALATARAQLRLQDRGPDVARTDAASAQLEACKAKLERLKNAEAERSGMLNTRYRGECRIAAVDAERVLDSFVELFRAKLRLVGRANRDGASSPEIEVGCDGVRRLAFMKLFRLAHDFAFYTSAAFHAPEPVRHTVEQESFSDLFGNSLCHEERTGVFYVATAPMQVEFDPNTERVTLKCKWAEQNALRDLARNFRF